MKDWTFNILVHPTFCDLLHCAQNIVILLELSRSKYFDKIKNFLKNKVYRANFDKVT
jgi:hypothetical protein